MSVQINAVITAVDDEGNFDAALAHEATVLFNEAMALLVSEMAAKVSVVTIPRLKNTVTPPPTEEPTDAQLKEQISERKSNVFPIRQPVKRKRGFFESTHFTLSKFITFQKKTQEGEAPPLSSEETINPALESIRHAASITNLQLIEARAAEKAQLGEVSGKAKLRGAAVYEIIEPGTTFREMGANEPVRDGIIITLKRNGNSQHYVNEKTT